MLYPNTCSLGEFLKQFLLAYTRAETAPYTIREHHWHETFYELHRAKHPFEVLVVKKMFFNWDGPYPVNKDLREYLHALTIANCFYPQEPGWFDVKFLVREGLLKLWADDKISPELQKYITWSVGYVEELWKKWQLPLSERT